MRSVVFGGASGIGEAIVKHLTDMGEDDVIVIDQKDHLGVLQASFPLENEDEISFAITDWFSHIYITFGAPSHRTFDDTDRAKEAILIRSNYVAVTSALRFIKKYAIEEASYIVTSSVSASRADPGGTTYAASKAALDSLVRSLAREWVPARVNAIAPGPTATDQFMKNVPIGNKVIEAERSPFRRLIHPNEVAEAAVGLSLMTGVSGVILPVDLAGLSSSRRV